MQFAKSRNPVSTQYMHVNIAYVHMLGVNPPSTSSTNMSISCTSFIAHRDAWGMFDDLSGFDQLMDKKKTWSNKPERLQPAGDSQDIVTVPDVQAATLRSANSTCSSTIRAVADTLPQPFMNYTPNRAL